MRHDDELKQRVEDGDETTADEAGIRALNLDELDQISGGGPAIEFLGPGGGGT